MKLKFILGLIFLMGNMGISYSQYLQPTGTDMVTYDVPCGTSEDYYDEGGVSGNYSNNTNSTVMFCATEPTCTITVEFSSLDIEASEFGAFCWDELNVTGDANGNDGVYSGDASDLGNDLPCIDGTDAAGGVTLPIFQSTPGGCLSFNFDSDGSTSQAGWEAMVSSMGESSGDDEGDCSLSCVPNQTFNLDPGACNIPFPTAAIPTGDCTPEVPEPEVVEGFIDDFEFSSFTQYDDDFNAFSDGDYPKAFNSGPSTFNEPEEVTITVDTDSGFAFGVFSMEIPFDGTLSFDYEINGLNGTLYQGVGDPATSQIFFVDGQFGDTPQSGSFSIDLQEDDIFNLAAGISFFGESSEVTITNFIFTESVMMPVPYVVEIESATKDGEEAELNMEDDLTAGEYVINYQLIDPNGDVVDECTVNLDVIANAVNGGSLSCNDDVKISADQLCSVYLEADMFLEGSNYGCYEDYVIDIWVNNNPSNVVSDVNGQTIDFSELLGQHTFNVSNPETGNKCWGYFTVEDKQAPMPECPCSEAPEEFQTITGELLADSPTFSRWSGTFNQPATGCTTQAADTYRYSVVPFQVSQTGFYQLDATWVGDAQGAVFEGSFNPDDACENLVESNDDGAGGLDPQITVNLEAGVTYVYVMTTWSAFNTQEGEWEVTVDASSDGAFLEVDPDCIFNCTDIDLVLNSTSLTPMPDLDASDNCGIADSQFTDELEKSDCGESTIVRTWIFTDNAGNSASCQQIFTFNNIGIAQIELPLTPVILGCGADITPEGLAAAAGIEAGSPYVITQDATGAQTLTPISENVCSIYTSYTDQDLKACGDDCYGNRKVIRTWTIFDWCSQDTETFVQIIKSVDDEGPSFSVNDTLVSTRAWDCYADFRLPDVWELHDDCDENPKYTVSGPAGVTITPSYDLNGNLIEFRASGAPKGNHVFTYTAYDCCGNETKHDILVVVKDLVAPVVTTKKDIVVSLTPAGEIGGVYDGQAKLYPHHIDNGSYDMCTDVYLEIRRPKGDPACGNLGANGYNNNETYDNDGHTDDNSGDTDDGQFVKFCCEDLNAMDHDANEDGEINELDRGFVKVILRVWDDADMDGTFGTDGDNYNEGWAFVKVEDKLPPILTCPDDATIYCDWPIDLSSDFGGGFQETDQANFDATGMPTAYGVCGELPVTFRDQANLDQCGVGEIRRTWKAAVSTPTGLKEVTCVQKITVEARDSQFEVTKPSKDSHDWDSCVFDESMIPDNHKPRVTSGPCDAIGENIKVDTFLFENGVCKKWKVTYNYVNWCTGDEAGPFDVYYFYDDKSEPVIEDCENKMFGTDINCEHVLTVTNSATDNGGCSDEGWLKWQLFVDTWADGTVDYYGSSYSSRPNWTPIPKYNGNGTINSEWLALPAGHDYADVVYVKGIGSTTSGGEISVEIEKVAGQMSNHKVYWKVSDGCHNHATCHYDVMVADKKAPTPYCLDISTALMQGPNKMVELWANDFDLGATDNCTPQDWLAFTFFEAEPQLKDTIIIKNDRSYPVNRHVPHYFDENNTFVDFDSDGITPWTNGIVYPKTSTATLNSYNAGLNFSDGSGTQKWKPLDKTSGAIFRTAGVWGLHVSVWDEKCNTEFCTVTLNVTDNESGDGGKVSGRITTKDNEGVLDVNTTILASIQEYPISQMTDVNGNYSFVGNPFNHNYSIIPTKDENFRNGLSTIDIVKIQRHILGIQPFTSPYEVIAADLNGNENIEPLDLLLLRKLVLNIASGTSNSSWRFVDKTQTFTNVANPWPLREQVDINNLTADMTADFVAVKIGDVNGTAELRSNVPVLLMAEDVYVERGEQVEIQYTVDQDEAIFGTQFSMNLNGLIFNDVTSGAVEATDINVGRIDNNMITFSTTSPNGLVVGNTEVMFTMNFRAERSGAISEMITLSPRNLNAEIYIGEELEVRPIELGFRNKMDVEQTFELLQNEPNPFKENTVIGYQLPQAGKVTFSITDVTGKVLMNRIYEGVAGYNEIVLSNSDISATGVLYYTIKSGDNTATKKMISIQ